MSEGRDHLVARVCAEASRSSASPSACDAEDTALLAPHLGYDRQAEGRPAYDRRLSDLRLGDPPLGLRHPRRRRLVVRRRRRLGHRPQLHRLRPAQQRATGSSTRAIRPTPKIDRHWEIIARYGVSQYYTAPTLIRAFMKEGDEHPKSHDLSSLRCSEPSASRSTPRPGIWYHRHVGGGRCPVVDTWWQTETGGIMIGPLPGVSTLKPGSATSPLPGIEPLIVDDSGDPVEPGTGGYLDLEKALARASSAPSSRTTSATSRPTSPSTAPRPTSSATAPAGRRRRLLAAGPDRRRHERLRPPALDDRVRVGAGRPPGCRRGSGHSRPRSVDRPDAALLRHPARRVRGSPELAEELRDYVARADRQDRPTRRR